MNQRLRITEAVLLISRIQNELISIIHDVVFAVRAHSPTRERERELWLTHSHAGIRMLDSLSLSARTMSSSRSCSSTLSPTRARSSLH
mgnify:CR=1 FL=1